MVLPNAQVQASPVEARQTLPLNVGLDIGFGYAKLFATEPREVKRAFATWLGEYATPINMRGRGSVDTLGANTYLIALDGTRFVIGDNAHRQSTMRIGATNEQRFSDAVTLRAITLTGLGLVSESIARSRFQIVTGLPLTQFNLHRKDVIAALSGHFSFSLNGNPIEIDIAPIPEEAIVPSTFGVWADFALDLNGSLNGNLKGKSLAVVDPGTGTTDFSLFDVTIKDVPVFLRPSSKSIDVGWLKVTDMVAAYLSNTVGTNATHYQIDAAVRDGTFKLGHEEFGGVAREGIQDVARAIADTMKTLWGSGGDIDTVVIAGGASAILGPEIQKLFQHPDLRVLPDPFYAIARGYRKWASLVYGA